MSAVAWGKWLCSSMAAVVTSANGDDCEIEILHSALGPGGPRLGVSYTDPTAHCIQVSPLHDLMRKYPFHADRGMGILSSSRELTFFTLAAQPG
ncbi:hypothetical protein BJV77DRAFT_1009286 [Russula vinacea]|nr:hypothetical protein BJV77DRAFT_1009286 [Russula vinacea]